MRISTETFSRLVVYDNGKILFEKGRDLTKVSTFENGRLSEAYLSKIEYINLPEVKNARKENLFRKDCYFLKYTDPVFTWERKQALYIHVSCIEFEDLGEHVANVIEGETNYLHYYRLHFPDGFRYRKRNIEHLNVPEDWELPKGASWTAGPNCYRSATPQSVENRKKVCEKFGRPFEPFNMIHEWTSEQEDFDNVYASDYYTRQEKDSAREDRERIANAINEALGRYTVSHYDVAKLLEKLTIEVK
jgi:hypothetical protein